MADDPSKEIIKYWCPRCERFTDREHPCYKMTKGNDWDYLEFFFWVIRDCVSEYTRHSAKRGNGWINYPIEDIYTMMDTVIEDWRKTKKIPQMGEYDELIDVLNVAMMLAWKVKRRDGIKDNQPFIFEWKG